MPRSVRPDMPGYGVPEEPDGLLDWTWGSERLERSRNYWVVTATSDGRPHAMPVWGLWMPERDEFFFTCSPQARKVRNLRANPRITVAADSTVEVVSLEGVATEVAPSDVVDLIHRWAAKYEVEDADGEGGGQTADELADFLAGTVAFIVRPERAFGLIETPEDFGPKATKWQWDTVSDDDGR